MGLNSLAEKDFHSIHVQAVGDYAYTFFEVVVQWPVSVYDTRIFSNSRVLKKLSNGEAPNTYKVEE